ncbi:MAG: mannose-1-phosphate guanylyltransferase [Planctomycetota bacterium]|nr:mannose-1-phosphate guanylyltransferase [Planctomycetota bacterium]
MAGGASSRLWPASDPLRPKWDLHLFGECTLLQAAWARARKVAPAPHCLVVAGRAHAERIRASLPDLPPQNLLIEPEGRDTSGAVAYAAGRVLQKGLDGVMLILPGDHVISPVERFARCALAAGHVAVREAALVTFGIVPRAPATAYGYVHRGDPLEPASKAKDEPLVFLVRSFKEKPDRATAERYVRSAEYFWNGGIFAFPMALLMQEMESHLPGHAAMALALSKARSAAAWKACAAEHFPKLEKISIDFGIMEKARKVATVAADFEWDDIGSWTAVGDHLPKQTGNAAGPGVTLETIESQGNVVIAPGRRVALIGVQGIAVIDDPAGLLICRLDQDQLVKQVSQKFASATHPMLPKNGPKSAGKRAARRPKARKARRG